MKPFYQSKTLIGILLAALAQGSPEIADLARAAGIEITPEIAAQAQLIGTLVGLALSAYGRFKATHVISVMPPKKPADDSGATDMP